MWNPFKKKKTERQRPIKDAATEPDNFTQEEAQAAVKAAVKKAKETKQKSPKEIATEKGEPWVNILSMDIDPEDINSGAFELDWNDKFVMQLSRFGYTGKTDNDIVDQWFQQVCRNIALETYEQYNADLTNPARYHEVTDLGNGKKEIK